MQVTSESSMSEHPKLTDALRRKKTKEEESCEDESFPSALNSPSLSSPSTSNLQNEYNQELKKWIQDNISKQECCFFQRHDSKEEICHCGYTKEKHSYPAGDFTDGTKKPEDRVCKSPTDAFGYINFGGLGQKTSKYVRVSADTEPKLLYELLTKQWKLNPPNLVISVTGGARNFYLKPYLTKVFYRGIVKIAQTTGAWIITGGIHAGVMMHVGKALNNYTLSHSLKKKIVAIGVAPWGIIHNRNKLIRKDGHLTKSCKLDTEEGTCLDNNHTHFLLVDDGTTGEKAYCAEVKLRAELEKYISNQHGVKAIKIPVVCMVLDGGLGTIRSVYLAIQNNTPCVFLEGSGRVADVIAHVLEQRNDKHKNMNDIIKDELKKFFNDESLQPDEIDELKDKIQKVVAKSDLLTVFKAKENDQRELGILHALTKALKDEKSEKAKDKLLKLAIDWNRVDLAEENIFTKESQWKSNELEWAMTLALVGNKPKFVRLLLENGVILKNFLKDDNTLCELYQRLPKCFFLEKLGRKKPADGCRLNSASISKRLQSWYKRVSVSPLKRSSPSKHFDCKDISLPIVAKEVRCLLGKFTKPIYPSPPKDGEHTVNIDPEPKVKENVEEREEEAKRKAAWEKEARRDAGRDLFLWAVLQNNKGLADIAWGQCRDCISAALAASKILKKMSEKANNADKTQEMLELARHYENHAIGVFSECYNNNEERAQKLLVRVSRLWGETTCLRLALEADDKNFVAHSGVQALLTQIWWGKLSDENCLWKVGICMVIFPLIYIGFLDFREMSEIDEGEKTEEEERISHSTEMSEIDNEGKKTEGEERISHSIVQSDESPYWKALEALYCSPQVKFFGNIVSYFAFLILFAYVLMIDFQSTPSVVEILLYIWLFTLVCEEIRQLFYDPDNFGFREKAKVYIKEVWNILDVLSILGFCLGLAFRLTTKLFYPGKIILCIDFVVFCLRLMAVFTISRTLGPKIIIVKKMMMDIFFFMFLLSIWVMAYGVAKQGILIENDNRLDWIVRGAIYEPYLVIFGSFPENIDNAGFDINSCSMNGTDPLKPKCPVLNENQMPVFPEWITIIMLCVYLLFANILLLNLLIAVFNYTFEEVHENTDRIWKFQRYQLIKEYYSRPAPPPPFIILSHFYLFTNWVWDMMKNKNPQLFTSYLYTSRSENNDFKKYFPREEEDELLSWEAVMKDKYLLSAKEEKSQSIEGRTLDTSKKVEDVKTNSTELLEKMKTLEQQVTKILQRIEDVPKSQDVPATEAQPQSTDE